MPEVIFVDNPVPCFSARVRTRHPGPYSWSWQRRIVGAWVVVAVLVDPHDHDFYLRRDRRDT